jgi:hypothetical protein
MLGNGGAGELFGQQPGEVYDRGAWPIARHDVLSLSGGVALDQNDAAERLAVELRYVVFDEPIPTWARRT